MAVPERPRHSPCGVMQSNSTWPSARRSFCCTSLSGERVFQWEWGGDVSKMTVSSMTPPLHPY